MLLAEVVASAPTNSQSLLDCTLGGAGHSQALLAKFPKATLYGIDRDPTALAASRHRLAEYPGVTAIEQASFLELPYWAEQWNTSFDFILADLGMSSEQLAAPERGFSFCRKASLTCEWIRSDRWKPLHRFFSSEVNLRSADYCNLRRRALCSTNCSCHCEASCQCSTLTTRDLAELVERDSEKIPEAQLSPSYPNLSRHCGWK